MARYRHRLPQLDGGVFLTDSGLETDRLQIFRPSVAYEPNRPFRDALRQSLGQVADRS